LSVVFWLVQGSAVPAQLAPQAHPLALQVSLLARVVQSGAVPPHVPEPVAQRHPDSLGQVVLSVRLVQVAMVPLHVPEPTDH
jgi:hypothetical protein